MRNNMKELHQLTVSEAAAMLARRDCSAVDLVEALLKRIAERDGGVQAYLTVDAEGALAQAAKPSSPRGRTAGALAGIPIPSRTA
jgi:aspartyl-tRNA(Asn)/glutamyl-tRNA(Gln) amidotransferase subunit A